MGAGRKWRKLVYTLRPPHHVFIVIMERADLSLVIQGWVIDKTCHVTMDTGAYVTGQAQRCLKDSQTSVTHCRQYLGKPSPS
jgi:hypothetical protein